MSNFFFILERIVLKHATHIIKLNDELEVQHYLKGLEENKEILKLKMDCRKRIDVYLRLKQVLYELYCFSFCNENVLKLCDYVSIKDC